MALRLKTVEYPFETRITSLAATTRYDFPQITLHIPEVNSRTFRSVSLVCQVRHDSATAASSTAWLMGIKLGGVAFSDSSVTSTITNSGEHQSLTFTKNVTSYFATNFGSGASQTAQASFSITALPTTSITMKLIITYEYDDTAATTRVKTVRIPIESLTSTNVTNTLTEVGSNQVPALDTFLPEASKVYRSIWFEVFANETSTAVTDFSIGYALDSEAESTRALLPQALTSSPWFFDIWRRNDMTTNATHQFKVVSSVTGRFTNLGAVLHVTYEYNHTTSTSILQSLILSAADEFGLMGSTTAADRSLFKRDIKIAEPGPISLKQSGIVCYLNDLVGFVFRIKAGAQSYVPYTITAGSLQCGQYSLVHRIDAGGAAGADGITLTRGEVDFVVEWYSATAATGSNFSAYAILNYTSGKHSDGDGAHNHTVRYGLQDTVAATVQRVVSAQAPVIPESNYWLTGVSYVLHTQGTLGTDAIGLDCEVLSGEDAGGGWRDLYQGLQRTDAELGIYYNIARARTEFRRHPSDPDPTRLDIESPRRHRIVCTTIINSALFLDVTYHTMTWTLSGQVSGYTGDGSGLTVDFLDASTHEIRQTATTTAGGVFSAPWYDDFTEVYSSVRQDSQHVGRSDAVTAT